MMLFSGVVFLIGVVLIVFGLIVSTDGVEARRRRAQQTTVVTGQRTERVTDEVTVRRRITKERIT